MKFNPNFIQLKKWKFLQYHPVCVDELKYELNTLGFAESFLNTVKLFMVVTEIDQKKQAPWILHKDANCLWKSCFNCLKFKGSLLCSLLWESFQSTDFMLPLLTLWWAEIMYLIKEIGTCLFPGLLHPAKHFLMDSMDTYLVMMVHQLGTKI